MFKNQKSKSKNQNYISKFKILNFGLSFCILIFAFCIFLYAWEPSKEEGAFFVAQKAFADGFYEVSVDLLKRFLKDYPDSSKQAQANLLIGRCYFQQNRFLDALNKFEELLNQPQAKDLKDAVLYWIAEVHFKGNSFDKAASFYKRLIDEFPNSPYLAASLYSLGWCLFEEEKFNEALRYFEVVEKRFSQEPQAQDMPFKIIECLYNLKDYAVLKEKVKNYLKLYSKDTFSQAYLYFYFAEADYYLGNFNEAIQGYSKVIQNSRDEKIQALSKLGMGWSYLKSKRYKEAGDTFSEIMTSSLDKKSTDVLLLGKAILCYQTNRFSQAKSLYHELLNTTSDALVLIQAYLGKADAFYSLAEYTEAIDVYKEVLDRTNLGSIPPEIIDKLHYNLAWAYLKQAEFKEAIKEFQKIVRSSEDKIFKISALCQIGDTYQDSGDYQKAQETYDTILKDYPDSFYSDYVQYQLGLTMLKVSNYDGAIMSFLALKKNYPESKLIDDATYALGLAYFQKQDYNSSKEAFQKFKEEFKDSNLRPQGLYLLGTSLYNLGKFPEAIEVFKDIIRMYSQDLELVQKAEYEIADCFYQMGDEKGAMARFKTLRSKYPDSTLTPEIMWWLGEYYYRHNNLELARRYFSSLIQDFPKSNLIADAYYVLGSIYTEESRYQDAMVNFKKVIELDRSDLSGQAAVAIADIYVKLAQPDLAIKEYRNIIQDYPNLAHLIYPKMADLFYKIGNFNKAGDFYRKSLEVVPVREMAAIQFKLAEVLQAQGNFDQATEGYLKVTYLYSENNDLVVKALLRVAKIYEDKENFRQAMNIYEKVASLNVEEAKYAKERINWIRTHTK
jgi:TolA-binding protein